MRKGQTRKFTKRFAPFVCDGDRITARLPRGFTATAYIIRDDNSGAPDERQDGFWPSLNPKSNGYIGGSSKRRLARHMAKAQAVYKAWQEGEMIYCGVCVVIEKEGVDLTGQYDHTLWGVDVNRPYGRRSQRNAYLRDVANELLPEVLTAAEAKLEFLKS